MSSAKASFRRMAAKGSSVMIGNIMPTNAGLLKSWMDEEEDDEKKRERRRGDETPGLLDEGLDVDSVAVERSKKGGAQTGIESWSYWKFERWI